MRNLGVGQSVCFYAPPEVHRRILQCRKASNQDEPIKPIDILYWVLHESVIQTQQNFPLWASQGIDYQTRRGVWKTGFNRKQLKTAWRQKESKTLAKMYSSSNMDSNSIQDIIDRKLHDTRLRNRRKELLEISQRCDEYQITEISDLSLQELQEREVMRVVIEERGPKKEPRPEIYPHTHIVHPGLVQFIDTGKLSSNYGLWGPPFCTLMETLQQTTFSNQIEPECWSSNILTTSDFALTVKRLRPHWYFMSSMKVQTDVYLRPVTWILSTDRMRDGCRTLIILSPFEVNELLPRIRKSKFVNLHMYSAKVKGQTPNFYKLSSLAIPAIPDKRQWQDKYPEIEDLMVQIHLYAVDLFFDSYELYRKVCEFVGINIEQREPLTLHEAGYENKPDTVAIATQEQRLTFLRHLVWARRKEMKIDYTHMGAILNSRVLEAKEWEYRRSS